MKYMKDERFPSSLTVSWTAVLASPRKPKTKGVTVPSSFNRDSIGPIEPEGVLFHFLSAI